MKKHITIIESHSNTSDSEKRIAKRLLKNEEWYDATEKYTIKFADVNNKIYAYVYDIEDELQVVYLVYDWDNEIPCKAKSYPEFKKHYSKQLKGV